MRVFAYKNAAGKALGVMTDDTRFVSVADVAPDLPSSLMEILAMPDGLDRLRAAMKGRQGKRALSEVALAPFLDRPNAMWALALNFKTHIKETGLTTSMQHPHAFIRTAASYVCAGEPILAPPEEMV